jgi:hypothetical protein
VTAGLEVHSGRRVTGQVRVDGARGGSGSGESGSERDEHSGGGDQE